MSKKAILLILDGWGIGENNEYNAIFQAKPPFWNELTEKYPNAVIHCKEESVGLPFGCLSGSEVGHTILGAGRVVWQNAAKIDKDIREGVFCKNNILKNAVKHVKEHGGAIHLVGLLSDGGIHSHINHLLALVDWAEKENIKEIALHLFLDGRDMPPKSALNLLRETILKKVGGGLRITTICGRATAMDRSENWERTTTTFNLLTRIEGVENRTIEEFLEKQYFEGISDEFIGPTRFNNSVIEKDDAVVFFNFRADRMRQLIRMFTNMAPHTEMAKISVPSNLYLASLTEYDSEFREVWAIYPPEYPVNTLGEWISKKNLKQFRVAETEKHAHVTYFFNGGREDAFLGEERLIIPSLGLTNYASNPEMSLPELTKTLVRAIEGDRFDFIVCNIANSDMVGHSGDLSAGIKAVLEVDKALKQIVPTATIHGFTTLITADHGNIEQMWLDGQPQTAHTFNEVPLVVVDENIKLTSEGHLYQVAPTILKIMGLEKPEEMTGEAMF